MLNHLGDKVRLYRKLGLTDKQIETTKKQTRRKDE